ncbi:MAG: hypothetical protein AAF911_00435 [Planctomycetota bacterium]
MGRRQGRTPPYEIMQNVGSGAPLPRSGVSRVRGGSVGLLGLVWGGFKAVGSKIGEYGGKITDRRGFSSISERFVGVFRGESAAVRLPWPVLALVGVVFMAGMALMFQVGHHVAGRSVPGEVATGGSPENAPNEASGEAGSQDSASAPNTVVAMGTVPPGPEVPARDRVVLDPVESQGGSGGIAQYDPRAAGLNYFILATVRPSEVEGVRELQKFLAANGLETFLDSVNNDRLRVLVDVTRGFTREELRNLEYAEHEQRIRSLGRAWKKQQGGIGTDLSDIYRDRFDGPTQ